MTGLASSVFALLAASCLSVLVHVGIGMTANPRGLQIDPQSSSCRVGEQVRLGVRAKSLWGQISVPESDLRVQVPGASRIGRVLPGGVVACEAPGNLPLRIEWKGLQSDLHLHVHPAVVEIEAPPLVTPALEERPGPILPVTRPRHQIPHQAAPALREEPAPMIPSEASQPAGPDIVVADDPGLPQAPEGAPPVTDASVSASADPVATGLVTAPSVSGTAIGTMRGHAMPAPVGASDPGAAAGGRPAALRGEDPCAGAFPDDADVDAGVATLNLIVERDGRISNATVMSEQPMSNGFGRAARACMMRAAFAPARDAHGATIRSTIQVNVRFTR